MFDSRITAKDLITEIQNEADIAPDISTESYIQWLNSIEQLLYTEIIKEQKKYKFNKFSDLIRAKFNFCPVFSAETKNDVQLIALGNGEYQLKPTKVISSVTNTGATFTATVTLPAGTYTLSDTALQYQSNMMSGRSRLHVINTATGVVIAIIDVTAAPSTKATFTLAAETTIKVCINVPPGADLTSSGRLSKPQLDAGSELSDFVPPYADEELSYLLCDFPTNSDEAPVRFEDIHVVFADDTQLIKSTLTNGMVFPDAYFKEDNALGLHFAKMPSEFTVVYNVRPALKTSDTIANDHVRVPAEFIGLVKAKLRGEAYKLANEDALAAKWLSDYNVLLETFREWILIKSPVFGM